MHRRPFGPDHAGRTPVGRQRCGRSIEGADGGDRRCCTSVERCWGCCYVNVGLDWRCKDLQTTVDTSASMMLRDTLRRYQEAVGFDINQVLGSDGNCVSLCVCSSLRDTVRRVDLEVKLSDVPS